MCRGLRPGSAGFPAPAAIGFAFAALAGLASQALLQRRHEVDDIRAILAWLAALDRLAGRLALHKLAQRQLVLVLEFGWIEVASLLVEDVLSQMRPSPSARVATACP